MSDMSEKLKYEGRLLEYRDEAAKLKIKIRGLRDSIRDILDPFASEEGIKADVAAQQATELMMVQLRYREVLGEIRRIERYLGRDRG